MFFWQICCLDFVHTGLMGQWNSRWQKCVFACFGSSTLDQYHLLYYCHHWPLFYVWLMSTLMAVQSWYSACYRSTCTVLLQAVFGLPAVPLPSLPNLKHFVLNHIMFDNQWIKSHFLSMLRCEGWLKKLDIHNIRNIYINK